MHKIDIFIYINKYTHIHQNNKTYIDQSIIIIRVQSVRLNLTRSLCLTNHRL